MIAWEKIDAMNAEELAAELAGIDPKDWRETICLVKEIDPEKLKTALGIISMEEEIFREPAVLRALNTSCIPRPFLLRARAGRRRHPRELAARIISGQSKPGYDV